MPRARLMTPDEVGTISFSALGRQGRLELPRDQMIANIHLRVAGQIDKTAVATAGTVLAENPFTVFPRLQLLGGGRDVIKDYSLPTLAVLNRLNTGGAPNISTATTAAAGTNEAFNAHASMEFLYPSRRFSEPLDTVLDAPFLYRDSNLILVADSEGGNSGRKGFVTGNADHTYALDSLTMAVTIERLIVTDPEEAKRIGWMIPVESTVRSHDVTATSTSLRLNEDAGLQYRQILLRALLETGASHDTFDPSNAILDRWRIKAGIETFHNREEAEIRDWMVRKYELSAALTGAYLYDPSPEGKIKEALPTEGLTDFHHSLEVTKGSNTNRLEFTTTRYLPIPAKVRAIAG